MYTLTVCAALLAGADAFGAAPALRGSRMAVSASSIRMDEGAAPAEAAAAEAGDEEAAPAPPPPPAVEMSESLPFLVKRPQLKGYVGDVGFDPVGFSEIISMVSGAARTRSRTRAAVDGVGAPPEREGDADAAAQRRDAQA